MEVVVELALQGLYLFPVFCLFELKVTSQSLLFFPQFTNFKVSLFPNPGNFHLQIADFIVLLVDELLELSNFQLIFLSVCQVVSFQTLNLHILLVLNIVDLYVFMMLDFRAFLFELLNLVQQSLDLKLRGGASVSEQAIMFVFPNLYF